MLSLHGLALPLTVAVLLLFSPWRFSRGIAAGLLAYAARSAWLWWFKLVITIDGVTYKENPSAARKRVPAGSRPKKMKTENKGDGFMTPREQSFDDDPVEAVIDELTIAGLKEWAPFGNSLPYAKGDRRPEGATTPCWLPLDASVFLVRDIRYKQTKEKTPSDFALYDCVGMDMIRQKRRIDSVIERLPKGTDDLPSSSSRAVPWDQNWGVPRVLIIGCQLPLKAGRLIGSHPEDDGGLSVVSYFVLSARASEILAKGAETPSLRLWKRFVEEGTSTKEGIALKVMGRVEDLQRYEVPESFYRFNNKPVLLTKSAVIDQEDLPELMEINYDVRCWVYPARSALANYRDRAREAELEIAYVIEGKTDDELPEQVLGCFRLDYMDITTAQWINDA
eukprot:TRINITY_DN75724_c0_g1_i1.p1 TRINITY_DN75724_c0_g1~~TRINITY_DN75724_c0_g1_i1.p1  ORF type:complete len:393 (-),score=61.69 TRINITY_DN75724_c0_g1_i1:220-1398(-)